MNNRLSIYVSSPDSYADVFSVFLKGFHKYWDDCPYEFVLSTNTRHYPGIKCICNNLKNDSWVERTINAVKQINSKYILLMCDDIIISDKVDNAVVEFMLDYMDKNSIRYCRLNPIPGGSNIIESPLIKYVNKNTPYAINLQFGIFRRDFFVDLLGDGSLSSWEIENKINRDASNAPEELFDDVICVTKPVIEYIHGVYKGGWMRLSVFKLKRKKIWEKTNRSYLPLLQDIKISMINYIQWKISLSTRKKIKKTLVKWGFRFDTLN